ncbi:hypothetical protein [Melittangium boletus]|uniref:Uncharacterized protein n=1 Tax=Melittangium boletus DSM 14713 TaxID=1294270 RepID=A0A250IHB2_9BACT|nr:hypothetical protein [Melittangium boletus]ATB31204.1 hypothetical protein MEBOL_004666 [Melittangium boletus DSM 14713]
MKYFGGVIVVLYAWMALTGWEPFTRAEKGKAAARTGGGGGGVARYRSGSFMGGK